MITQSENVINQKLGTMAHLTHQNEIRKDGYMGSAAITKQGTTDPYFMNLYAD